MLTADIAASMLTADIAASMLTADIAASMFRILTGLDEYSSS